MEKPAILLSLPRQNTKFPNVQRPAGLPINALPGWELIPLYSKLPMLKCPDNQVIFSKNKIGRSLEMKSQDFDVVCLNAKMDYNPLHDRHLRRFYSNEKLLKRLRENGEITQNNDVICTLKEFNEHRIPLHEAYISLIRIELSKQIDEKRDQQLINHAEEIAEKYKSKSGFKYSGEKLLERKMKLSEERNRYNENLKLQWQQKEEKVENFKAIQDVLLHHKRELNNLRLGRRLEASLDIQRKRLIALKKHLQFKSERLARNRKLIQERTEKLAQEKAKESWDRHFKERIVKHEQLKKIRKENERMVKEWIKNHMAKCRRKWESNQSQLKNKLNRKKMKTNKYKNLARRIQTSLRKSDQDQLRNLTSQDIHDALETAIDLTTPNIEQHYNSDDYIFKAAKYILEDILAKFDKDLSDDISLQTVIGHRISRLFRDVKNYVIKRASQIVSSERSCHERNESVLEKSKRFSLMKGVSFTSFSTLIGKGSYAIHEGDLKLTVERFPTPSGSLTSVVIEVNGENDEDVRKQRLSLDHLSRNDRIFVEHLFVKFKRELIVGVGRQVLAAIECHRKNKILNVRKELQEITKQFLVKLMARSILSYAINNCNFQSNALLCQHALAGDIILNLQKSLLKPKRDPRVIVQPHCRRMCTVPLTFSAQCKYKQIMKYSPYFNN